MNAHYDAILIVAFGGPEGPNDVLPFLENVTRGRNIPRERLLQVAEHYMHFGGVSPLNAQVRELMSCLHVELDRCGSGLPMYWGNRNWHPLLADTVQQMTGDGIQRALAVVLSAYSSHSSCRQYLENIGDARAAAGSAAPRIDKVRVFYNHPDFVAANLDRVCDALRQIPADAQPQARIAFTAHSIPKSMSDQCDYEQQLLETCSLVAEKAGIERDRWRLVYQSRSGRPTDPWLEPDIVDHLRELHEQGVQNVVAAPIGFLSDHVEVLFDLDHEAKSACDAWGLNMFRAATVGTHPRFVAMLRDLIQERLFDSEKRAAIGRFGAGHDVCSVDCCAQPRRV